jgi:uncharacterized protein YyaL (SSP411 family)
MPNRLAREASPYLLQHAANPVDWYPWGPEALEKARREDRPILLSIGYSACHWCHVMEHESFENEQTARLMNDWFVSVKVDREERPDLDQVYQLVVQLMGRSGGWPLTVFLTPEQRPFFGGTYFPPVDKYGVPGLPKLMSAVLEAYTTKRGEIDAQADEITRAIQGALEHETRPGSGWKLGPDLLERATKKLDARFDDRYGGFGSRPKFPNTMALDLLLRRGSLEKDDGAFGRARFALDRMRAGGVYDQLGGGFHRYSTDAEWLVPHFEKMLYDNALLLRLYVDAWRATGDDRFAATAREIAVYVAREMTAPDGAFYATQDADSDGEEGKFFVWTPAEIRAALGEDEEAASVALACWGVTDDGNFEEAGGSGGRDRASPGEDGGEPGRSVLFESMTIAEAAVRLGMKPSAAQAALERARAKLFEAREQRAKPFRDEKILASWNGLMIGALADAGAALGDAAMVHRASRAMDSVASMLFEERPEGPEGNLRVKRLAKDGVAKGDGFLDDYAFLADACIDLYGATGDAKLVAWAKKLADAMLARFWDAEAKAFFFTPSDGEALIHRTKDLFDHAVPASTAIACRALLRLGFLADERYVKPATEQLESLAAGAVENPFGFGATIAELDRLVRGGVDVVIAGDPSDVRARELAAAALRAYAPNRTVAWGARDGMTVGPGGEPRVYVCRGRACSAPIVRPEDVPFSLRAP